MLSEVGKVYEVAPSDVERGERLRPVDPIWAGGLAQLIAREGQHTPAEVCRLPGRTKLQLVFGGHRHAAAEIAQLPLKVMLGDAEQLGRRAREVSENLFRRGLDPIDRSTFVAELHELARARVGLAEGVSGQTASINARWKKRAREQADNTSANLALVFGMADEVAEQVGLSKRSIYRDLVLHRGLAPDLQASLRGHPEARKAAVLRSLALLPADQQRLAVRQLLSGEAASLADAMARASGKVAPSPRARAWSACVGGYMRLSVADRRLIKAELARIDRGERTQGHG